MSTETTTTVPFHKTPQACHVCGRARHGENGHAYWSNADAFAEADGRDRCMTFGYPSGATTPSEDYVAQHRKP